MDQPTQSLLEEKLKSLFGQASTISRCRSVSGGSISRSFHLEMKGPSATDVFVKLNNRDKLQMFAAEQQSLTALAETNTVRVPRALSSGITEHHSFLILEYVEMRSLNVHASALLGEQLAALHQTDNGFYGFQHEGSVSHGYIGLTQQLNTPNKSWTIFFAQERLAYQLDLATKNGLTKAIAKNIETIIERIDDLLQGHCVSPSLLHGDLWGGNAAMDRNGEPIIFDPASYYGDRETDLAMTELFGQFPAAFYRSYSKTNPLQNGYQERKHLYNLYHLINHFNLFGAGYEAQVNATSQHILSKLT